MRQNKLILFLVACLLIFPLLGCQTATQTTELVLIPSETLIPSTTTPVPMTIPTDSPISPTATHVPTESPVPLTPTITALPEHRVTSIDELVGVWRGKWDANYLHEFTSDGQSRILFEQYLETVERELFTIEDGLFKWGDILYTIGEPQECLDNPVATYEVYITYRGDQPESLRWVLVGEENCEPRYKYLTVFPITWFGDSLP
jgi:hypothetical protein